MPSLDDELLQELLGTFRVEAAEHLQTINQALLKLERTPDEKLRVKTIQDAFRAAHSLKGASRAVGQGEIETLAHSMESVFQQARDQKLALEADVCDVLYDGLDVMEKLLNGDSPGVESLRMRLANIIDDDVQSSSVVEPSAIIDSTSPVVENVADETIRVSVGKLDDLMAQVGELLVARISADQRLHDMRDVQQKVEHLEKTWREIKSLSAQIRGDVGRHLEELLSHQATHINQLVEGFRDLDQAINRDTMRLGMVTSNLQDGVRKVRMVPFQSLAFPLERAVRDAARVEGKSVQFVIEGGHVELDKKILETLKDPLLHLVRNAVVHGLEAPDLRAANGKSPEGRVQVSVFQRGSEVHILVQDDGRGFDVEALRIAYINRTGRDLDSSADEAELINLAFIPGLTTAAELTGIAGRGVGLDIVRQSLASIQGRISVENYPGHGATFQLVVPMSLTMTRGLLVRAGAERYALPLLAIEKIIEPESHFVVGGKLMITVDERSLPLVPLTDLLKRPSTESARRPLAIILSVAEQRLAVLVDDILTEQELAVKTLGWPLQRVANVTGAALLGSGEPVVILNPADLLRSAQHVSFAADSRIENAAYEDEAMEQIHILVVDDSITTRTLEKNILEAADFEVTTATDGIEALKRLEISPDIRLVVADVEMPNMDGITLVQTLREHTKYQHLPIILVTSLESREDRERGMLAGADAYIVKRGFDQAELLATIRRLL
jgi:two-component system, chemotaxis family, sensor kinase CheA